MTGVRLELRDPRVAAEKLVRVRGRRAAGQSVESARRVEGERVPALRAPGLADLTAFEHDVFDAGVDEPLAYGESGVAGTNDYRVQTNQSSPGAPARERHR